MGNKRCITIWLACIVLIPTSFCAAANVMLLNEDLPNVGFNDPTVTVPVGGNPGTTLGQQRLNVFLAAASKWGATLNSPVTIRVRAFWMPLDCATNSAILGTAGATSIFRDFDNAPVAGHWYAQALANKFAGTDLDLAPDIIARFNINLGQTGCLPGTFFYLGLDNNHGSNVDLYTVILHELAHGLGFQTFTDGSTGEFLDGLPSIWDDFIFDNTINKTWTEMTPGERSTSATNSSHLVWNGALVTSTVPLVLQPSGGGSFIGADAQGRARLYAPGTFQLGASVSHYDLVLSPNQLMEPSINADLSHEVTAPNDLTFALFRDIGWDGPNLKRRTGQVTSQD